MMLKKAYERKYFRVNVNPEITNRIETFDNRISEIPEDTRVIHGHFYYSDAVNLFQAVPDVPIVTWLRNPIDRMISRYYYSKRKFEDGDQPHKTHMAHYSLLDFVRDERCINEMSLALKGVDLADLAFVGILEHLEEDVAYLAAMLNWRGYKIPERNTNRAYRELS